ncbi:hypothetical protein OPQ81_005501 [Rhizoctonia solani]|nr:hypothetical protein OPQ81_005501 [Rhizoctonia solani]
MVAISEAGLLQRSESEELRGDVEKLRQALANMFAMFQAETQDSLVDVASRECAELAQGAIDGCLEDKDNSPLYPLHIQEKDRFGQLIPESPSELALATNVIQSLWAPQGSWQPHPWSSSLYQLEVQSLAGTWPVKITPNDTRVPELDVVVEPTATVSRPILKPLHIEGVAPRSMPPHPHPWLQCSSAISTMPVESPRAPRSCTPDLIHSNSSTLSNQSGHSFRTARSRGTTQSLFAESQVAQVMRSSPVPGPSRSTSLPRKGRSQSRLAKMKSKSRSIKKPKPADISKATQMNRASEWIVISTSSSRIPPPRRKVSSSSFRRSLYAQSSISSRHSGINRTSSAKAGIVKSPSIRSGLTSLSAKPEIRASQSRSALHISSRARLYTHGVNPKASAAPLQTNGLCLSPSTNSLPDASKESLALSKDMSGKENQPPSMTDGTSPIEFTLQLAAPFEAAIDRRFARSNFTISPPTPGPQRSRSTKTRPSGVSHKQALNEVHALVAGMGNTEAPLRRAPTITVPPRSPARVAMGARTSNWI